MDKRDGVFFAETSMQRWRRKHRDQWNAYQRDYRARNPERFRDYSESRPPTTRRTPPPKPSLAAAAAQQAVHRAVKSGVLVRPASCENCGRERKIEAAHFNYVQQLLVRWLCRSCHVLWDRQEPKGGTR